MKNPSKQKTSYTANLNIISLIWTFTINLVGKHGLEEMEQLACFTGIEFYNFHKMTLFSLHFFAIQMRKPS